MATIAVLNVGLVGHVGPATRLAAVLVRQGHRVLAWAPEGCRDEIKATGADFHPQEELLGPVSSLVGFAAALAEAADRCVGEIIEQLFACDVELVVHDCHAPWARVAGDFLGLPRIATNPLFPIKSSQPVVDRPAGADPLGSQDDYSRVDACRRSIGRKWGVELGDWSRAMFSTGDATVSFSTEEITGAAELPAGWCYVGPLMDAQPRAEPGTERPLVYVAFGTFFNGRLEAFRAAIDGLESEPVDVIVSTGRGVISTADLEPLPSNVVVRDFVRSREVLAGASVHVTHGGCSSVHESLLAGVPMVCLPQGSDQFEWSRRVEALGAGQIVDETPFAVREGVTRLLADGRARGRANELGERLASYSGEARVAEVFGRLLAARGGTFVPASRPV